MTSQSPADPEWDIPNDTGPEQKTETKTFQANTTPTMTFVHEGEEHLLPISLWVISEEYMVSTQPKVLIRSLAKPDRLTVIIPVLNDMIPLTERVMARYFKDLEQTAFVTDPPKAANAIERVYDIGDAFALGIVITVGDKLKEDCRELAHMAADHLMNHIHSERQSRLPVPVGPFR